MRPPFRLSLANAALAGRRSLGREQRRGVPSSVLRVSIQRARRASGRAAANTPPCAADRGEERALQARARAWRTVVRWYAAIRRRGTASFGSSRRVQRAMMPTRRRCGSPRSRYFQGSSQQRARGSSTVPDDRRQAGRGTLLLPDVATRVCETSTRFELTGARAREVTLQTSTWTEEALRGSRHLLHTGKIATMKRMRFSV